MYIHTYVYTYICIGIHMYIHTYVYLYICIYIYMHTNVPNPSAPCSSCCTGRTSLGCARMHTKQKLKFTKIKNN